MQQRDQIWHSLDATEVTQVLGTHLKKGIPDSDVEWRQFEYGVNKLTEYRGQGPIKRFLLQFNQPLVYILLAAVIVTLSLQEWIDSAVIFAVVLLNAVIGFIQESKALQAISALSRSLNNTATVIRGGHRKTIPAEQLVFGDLVLLQSGDKIPADMRLVTTRDLQIDESALTGESVPVTKNADKLEANLVLGDRCNMAYSSALVTYGTGAGLVIATGDDTEIGKISTMIATTKVLDTPLTKRIKRFSHLLVYAILALAFITVLIGALRGEALLDSFMAAVALAVGAIPEGLPAAVTIMLAIGVARMAKHRAIIRNLPAVETLGSTTVICSDKTGTLTKNEMTVRAAWAAGQSFDVAGHGYDPKGAISLKTKYDAQHNITDVRSYPLLEELLKAGMFCNESRLLAHDDSTDSKGEVETRWRIDGDPTEGALLVSAYKAGLHDDTSGRFESRLDSIPFESEYQYMATLHTAQDTNLVYVKGSLEAILARSEGMLNELNELIDIDLKLIKAQADAMASQGLRVLAFARKTVANNKTTIEHADVADSLHFIGLQAMIDPPRPEVAAAVAACHQAGIDVKMITGDHALTAMSIAKQLNIVDSNDETQVITGQQLSNLNDVELVGAASNAKVFARVTPDNKLQLVQALQSQGHVVAMTGDGVNDAPALKRADIGVAMALNGTEVAREAADMMLTDDNFATIQSAVKEGRGVFDNLKKFIVWTLPTNGGEALVILLAVLLGVSLPLLPVHILWVNMTTAVCLGLMLAFEPKESGIMRRPPHQPKASILDRILLWRIVLVSSLLSVFAFGLYELELLWGATEAQARTVAVAMFVVGEAFYLFNCRSLERSVFSVGLFSNPLIWLGIAVMAILQLVFTYLPAMNSWFHTAAIGWDAWLRVFACGALIAIIVGLEKHWRYRSQTVKLKSSTRHARAYS